jgi:hypothetical protein
MALTLVFLCLTGLTSNSQAPGTTAQAKQHYQNAVAAIDKGDWQTAKSELLQAQKLTPGNALVHYDLALAYSHVGEEDLAKSEVIKALQLGLPPDTRKQARELETKLTNQLATGAVKYQSHRTGVAAALRYFVGDWVEQESKETEQDGCKFHLHHERRLSAQPNGADRLSVKFTYFDSSAALPSVGCDWKYSANGTSSIARKEHYEGSIWKEGSEVRLSVEDGTCAGDCAGVNTSGATYLLQVSSEDEFVRIYKPTGVKIAFKRE